MEEEVDEELRRVVLQMFNDLEELVWLFKRVSTEYKLVRAAAYLALHCNNEAIVTALNPIIERRNRTITLLLADIDEIMKRVPDFVPPEFFPPVPSIMPPDFPRPF
ncbi:hypothetical protein Y032_0093g2654 [Ancylostoma ceylanicum]|uniref:Uncharacterized protein n=1 Tax=Ancylostoma ceylanicum TaxID=53326 RepID=A0A016TKS9_9BILA|nr:hypothetical protein Y032_0093g2654 [Ancylostoma ceylanicum]